MLARVAASLGAACVVIAVFLYEGEEKKIQSRIAAWWIRVDAPLHFTLTGDL
jgi:hypothetical protein